MAKYDNDTPDVVGVIGAVAVGAPLAGVAGPISRGPIRFTGSGWSRFQQRVAAMQVSAREMARTRFLIGSNLPYASHWIEEGWRDDPKIGRVTVNYRTPGATHFMRASAEAFGARFGRRRPSEGLMGAVSGAGLMQQYADEIADSMREILNAEVYSAPIPTSGNRPKWQRSHALYNSIKAYRA